MTKNCKIKLYI